MIIRSVRLVRRHPAVTLPALAAMLALLALAWVAGIYDDDHGIDLVVDTVGRVCPAPPAAAARWIPPQADQAGTPAAPRCEIERGPPLAA
jgi:hypothetical protein